MMASKFPLVGGGPSSEVGIVQGRGLSSAGGSGKTIPPSKLTGVSEYLVHDIAKRLGGIQIAENPDHGLFPLAVGSQSWVKTQTTVINIRCSCGNIDRQPSNHHGSRIGRCSDSSEDESDDDEGLLLEDLLRILTTRDRDDHGERKKRGATLRNLVKGYMCGGEHVAEASLTQLLNLTQSDNTSVQEAALLALAQVCTGKSNAERLIVCKTVKRLLRLLKSSTQSAVVPAVAQALQQLTAHRDMKDNWLEHMITEGLGIIIGRLQGLPSDESTMVAMINLLSQLAEYWEMSVMILDHCMYHIMATWKSYSILKAPMICLFERLVSHNDHTISGALDHGILHYASIILKDSDCGCQSSALKLYLQLCNSSYGLSALLEENKLTLAINVTMVTHCREVRKLGLQTLEKILELGTPSQIKELLLQIADHLDLDSTDLSKESMNCVQSNGRPLSGGEKKPGLESKCKPKQGGRVERGSRYLSQLLVHCLQKEGKISMDGHGAVQCVGYKPTIDQYTCLCYAANCVYYMATLPVHRPRGHQRTSSNNHQNAKTKQRLPNSISTQYLIEDGALCLVHILHKYTTYLTSHGVLPTLNTSPSSSTTQHRNLDVLYLKATMKLWQQEGASLHTRKRMRDILTAEEINFLRQVVQAVEVLARSCAEIWNEEIGDEIQEDLKRYQGWEGAGDARSNAPYQYVKTIDQAFHASHADKSNAKNPSKKLAWGDSKGSPIKNRMHSPSKTLTWKEDEDYHDNLISNGAGKELALSLQKKMRIWMYKTGVCACAGSLLLCGDARIQVLSIGILRSLIQPLCQQEVTQMQRSSKNEGGLPKIPSKASLAENLAERDRILSMVLQEMSSSTANVVQDALKINNNDVHQTKPTSATHAKTNIRPTSAKTTIRPTSAKTTVRPTSAKTTIRPSSAKTTVRPTSAKTTVRPSSAKYPLTSVHPDAAKKRPSSAKGATSVQSTNLPDTVPLQLSSGDPVYWQCTMGMLETCGHTFVHMLKCADVDVARAAMLILYDMVMFGEVIVHMKLASLGVLSILMQIISQHIDTKDISLLGLMTLEPLVFSEYRLKQLFMGQDGKEFLETIAQTSNGAVRAHIDRFVNLLSQSPPGVY